MGISDTVYYRERKSILKFALNITSDIWIALLYFKLKVDQIP